MTRNEYLCSAFMNVENIKKSALQTIAVEAQAIEGLKAFVNEDFMKAVATIASGSGRLVISGIGKSAIVAQKIVATLNSTGTPALFMHAADAIHGDLGMVQQGDVVMIISKSGESPEIKVLVPLVRNFGNTLIGMVGNTASYLATHSDIILNTTVAEEACPNNLAPTTSTTAQMVMGDALSVCLMEWRGFTSDDFAKFHPGGALGRKLYLTAGDLAVQNERPAVQKHTPLKDVIIEISRKRLGATAVLDADDRVLGIVTDGDVRRLLEKTTDLAMLTAEAVMSKGAKTIAAAELAVDALDLMRRHNISQLPVTDAEGRYEGMMHLHDLVREGLI
jgi:arabinose-5-phosphate isomerase